ncbi:hypothetical protein Hsar01_00387 [Haloferula sargassicola]|uniref:Uncharacterized protein n=1 Tax=Haloferula sargassicola TaxID=490096 RepID=A0ABP9UIX5_9BACT
MAGRDRSRAAGDTGVLGEAIPPPLRGGVRAGPESGGLHHRLMSGGPSGAQGSRSLRWWTRFPGGMNPVCTEAQRHRGTEAQRHRGTEAQRHRGTEAQRHRGTEAQRHKGTKAQRHKGTKAQRLRGSEAQRLRGSEAQRLRRSDAQTLRRSDAQTLRENRGKRRGGSRMRSEYSSRWLILTQRTDAFPLGPCDKSVRCATAHSKNGSRSCFHRCQPPPRAWMRRVAARARARSTDKAARFSARAVRSASTTSK